MTMSEGFSDFSRKFHIDALHRFDQDLQILKQMYISLNANARRELRDWLEKLTQILNSKPKISLRMLTCLTIDGSVTSHGGENLSEVVVRLNPDLILDAIRHWDRGDDYGPPVGKILS